MFRRYTSFLVSTSMLVQSISPAFAMMTDSVERTKKSTTRTKIHLSPQDQENSKKIYTTIENISEMDKTAGVVVQPGDWVILDIDRTVLKHGKGSNQDILNLDPTLAEKIKNWQAVNATEVDPKKHITIIFLTARKPEGKEETQKQLKQAGFPENIQIIFAPNDRSSDRQIPTKGKALLKRLETAQIKPGRLIMIDDLTENLTDVHDTLQNHTVYKNIPLKLLQRIVDIKICESSDGERPFPENLNDLTYSHFLGGGSGGVHVLKDKEGRLFTFKSATSSEQMKEEILADALYRSLEIKVPAFAVYDHLPELEEIKEACSGPGPYRLAQFIEGDKTATSEILAQEMRKHFVADALLSNFDIVIGGFKNVILDQQGNLWRLDNGGSLRIRALGKSKFGNEDWNPHEVKELETMRTRTQKSISVYGSLTEADLKEQALDILKRAPSLFNALDEMARKLHLNNPCEVREMLRLRLDDLVRRFLLSENGQSLQLMDGFMAPQFGGGILTHSTDPLTGKKVILLGKRRGHNWWCNFGGSRDLNKGLDSDKTLAHTAVREVQEESLGYLSYTTQELSTKPSHAILNSNNVFYRMYVADHPYVSLKQLTTASPIRAYGWSHEYSVYCWFPLDLFLLGLEKNDLVEVESRKTIKIGDTILYPYFWEMLQELPVKDTLENLCLGKKVRAKHTHDGKIKPIIIPLSVEVEKQQLAETIVKKGFVLGEVKALKPIAYKFQMSSPVAIGPKQRNVINIFIENGGLFLKLAHESSIQLLPCSATSSETEKFEHVTGQTYQQRKNGQKVVLLPDEPYNQIIAHVKKGTVLSDFEKQAMLMALGLVPPADYESEHSEEVQAMSGFLSNNEAEELKEALRNTPYTQTQAYLRHIMGEEVYSSLCGISDLEVDKFLEDYSKFPEMRLSLDAHYKQVLKEVMDAEKQNREKIMFIHGTDPLTCFLWDIITAHRSQLKNLGAKAHTTMRGLEKKFASILDVEAFIKVYAHDGIVSNYKTVNDTHYADLGLSVNPFLFGNDGNSTSASYYLFHKVQSVAPTNQEQLFTCFIATTGIPGQWKDYKALFNQYYLHDDQYNAKLFQIFVDPQVVDCVVYTAVAGGDVLGLTMDNKPYHGFAKIMAELRTTPEKSNEKIQTTINGKLNIKRALNNLQGRSYLNPKIFLEPKYVSVNSYWRHPLPNDMEASYYSKLNAHISQNLTSWLTQHYYLDPQTFVEGIPALKKSYQYAYEGQMGLTYREQKPSSFLPSAIKDGNAQLIKEILEKSPDIDINENLPTFTYRRDKSKGPHPLDLLTNDTPNFSEIIKIFVEKGLKTIEKKPPRVIHNKILNELVLYQDKMSKELLEYVNSTLKWDVLAPANTKIILGYIKEGYTNLVSYMFDNLKSLRVNSNIIEGDLLIILNKLETSKTIQELEIDADKSLDLFTLLMRGKSDWYKKAPWFEYTWDRMLDRSSDYLQSPKLFPFLNLIRVETSETYAKEAWFVHGWETLFTQTNDYIEYSFDNKEYEMLSKLIKETTAKEIDLRFLRHYKTIDTEGLEVLQKGLALNASINTLRLPPHCFNKEGLRELLKIPNLKKLDILIPDTHSNNFHNIIESLAEALRDISVLIILIIDVRYMPALLNQLFLNEGGTYRQALWFKMAWRKLTLSPIESIQDALTNKHWNYLSKIIENANVDDLNLEILSFSAHSTEAMKAFFKGLEANGTLKNLTLKKDDMLDVMIHFMTAPSGPYLNAPWFDQAKVKLFENPEPYISKAKADNNDNAILSLLKNSPKEIPLSTVLHYDDNKKLSAKVSDGMK